MQEPVWLSRPIIDAIHADQIRLHGGASGVRDENALESALARPRQKLAYRPDSSLPSLAAAYGFGLATNHGYNDGNKRIAFLAIYVFLGLNGKQLEAAGEEVVEVMLAVASGRLKEDGLKAWIDANMRG